MQKCKKNDGRKHNRDRVAAEENDGVEQVVETVFDDQILEKGSTQLEALAGEPLVQLERRRGRTAQQGFLVKRVLLKAWNRYNE